MTQICRTGIECPVYKMHDEDESEGKDIKYEKGKHFIYRKENLHITN